MLRHEWIKVRFVPPSGEQNAYFGRKCKKCGVRVYPFGRLTRWKETDGTVHDHATLDETSCDK